MLIDIKQSSQNDDFNWYQVDKHVIQLINFSTDIKLYSKELILVYSEDDR